MARMRQGSSENLEGRGAGQTEDEAAAGVFRGTWALGFFRFFTGAARARSSGLGIDSLALPTCGEGDGGG